MPDSDWDGSFRKNPESGRPEGTSLTVEGIIHYTCNAPRNPVIAGTLLGFVGKMFGVNPPEVVLMPIRLFIEKGWNPVVADPSLLTIWAEQILKSVR